MLISRFCAQGGGGILSFLRTEPKTSAANSSSKTYINNIHYNVVLNVSAGTCCVFEVCFFSFLSRECGKFATAKSIYAFKCMLDRGIG